jgi:hypothetical protein
MNIEFSEWIAKLQIAQAMEALDLVEMLQDGKVLNVPWGATTESR